MEVAISSGVLKFSVDLLRLFQCWFKQYLVVMVEGGVEFVGGEETFDEGLTLFLQEWLMFNVFYMSLFFISTAFYRGLFLGDMIQIYY